MESRDSGGKSIWRSRIPRRKTGVAACCIRARKAPEKTEKKEPQRKKKPKKQQKQPQKNPGPQFVTYSHTAQYSVHGEQCSPEEKKAFPTSA